MPLGVGPGEARVFELRVLEVLNVLLGVAGVGMEEGVEETEEDEKGVEEIEEEEEKGAEPEEEGVER
jgi:hypothetical protein